MVAEPITDCFSIIVASEREAVLLSDSLFLQHKLTILTTEKKRKCKEYTDVRALEGTGVHTELTPHG